MKKSLIFAIIAILTVGLFMACDSDVSVASKDDSHAYNEVTLENGVYVYKGHYFDDLQEAVNFVEKNGGAKSSDVDFIKVLDDVYTQKAVEIPGNVVIYLDLNGKTLQFLEVSSSAVKIGSSSDFGAKNGTLTLYDTSNEDLVVIDAVDGNRVALDGVTVCATCNDVERTALKVSKAGIITIKGGSIVNGDTSVNGASSVSVVDSILLGDVYVAKAPTFTVSKSTITGDTVVESVDTFSIENTSMLDGKLAATDSTVNLGNKDIEDDRSTINGDIALDVSAASKKTRFTTLEKTVINGNVVAAGADNTPATSAGDSSVALTINNKINKANQSLSMTNGFIYVGETGYVVMLDVDHKTANDYSERGNVYVAYKPTSSISFPADSDAVVTEGICYVAKAGVTTYYGSITQALADTNADQTIVLLGDDSITLDNALTIPYSVTIDLAGNNLTSNLSPATALTSEYTFTLRNSGAKSDVNGIMTGTLTGTDKASLVVDNVTVTGAVSGASSLLSKKATFNSNIGSTDKPVATLIDGEGSGTTADSYKNGSTFKGTVNVSGNITLKKSIIAPSITGDDDDFVRSDGSITMYNVEINNGHVGVFAAQGGSVSMTNSTGTAYKIIATNTGSNTLGTITIDNSTMTTGSFTVKNEVAARVGDNPNEYYGDVIIKGYVADTPAVSVDIIDAKNITVSYVTITNTNQGQSGTRAKKGGDITSDNSVFESVVEASGKLTDGAEATTITGSTFKNAIGVTGTSSFYKSTFNPSVNATVFYASTVEIKEAVFSTSSTGESTGKLYNIEAKKTETESSADKSEENLKITASTGFVGTLKTSGNTSNTVSELAETYHYYSNIVVDNSSFTAESPAKTLSVGDVSSTYTGSPAAYGNVTIKGGTTANTVTVSSISLADAVKTSYAVVTGDIGSIETPVATVSDGWTVSELPTHGYSTFNGNIYASGAGSFNNSTFAAGTDSEKTLNAGTLVINYSEFKDDDSNTKHYALAASGADYGTPSTSALKITNSTGKVVSLTATAGSINVDNETAEAALTVTGSVLAQSNENASTYYDVRLVGNANVTTTSPVTVKNVVVNGTIDGNDIVLTNATVNGSVTAKDVADDTATTDVDETDNGSITATHSTFTPSTGSNKELKGNTISVSDSTFNATDSYHYALKATGADPDANTSALKITTSTGKVASLTATAGSINVANSGASAALTVTGDVLACDNAEEPSSATKYYNVTLTGNSTTTNNIVVNGSIYGKSVVATNVTLNTLNESGKTVSGSTLSFTTSTFTDHSNVYALTASGADSDANTSALKITTSTGKVASLTATAGSIDVDNRGTSGILTVDGSVSATSASTDAKVKIVGKTGTTNVVVNGSVSAKTSFSAENAVVGNDKTDSTGDVVFSPAIEISNSQIVLYKLAASATESADTVTITSPVSGSAVADIATDELHVTAADDDANLVVDNVSITGTSTNNTIAGGTYKALTFKGTGVVSSTLTISKGRFCKSATEAGDFDFITGTTWIVGKYTSDYSVYMWGLDSLNSNTSIECAYIQSSKLSNLPNIVARVNQTSSNQKVYINYDPYYEYTDDSDFRYVAITEGAPQYDFFTNGTVYDVVLNFASKDITSTTSEYDILSGLFVTGTAMPKFNFGTNNITVTGRVFVTGEASVYSTLYNNDFVYLATAPTSSTHEWIVAIPAEAEYSQFKYKAGSMTLSASQLVVAEDRILIDTSTVGTYVKGTTETYNPYSQYHYNNSGSSEKVYSVKGTGFDVAHLSAGDDNIISPALKTEIVSWGPNVLNRFYNMGGVGTIWTNDKWSPASDDVWCYGNHNSTLDWHHYQTCPAKGHHIIVDINGGTF